MRQRRFLVALFVPIVVAVAMTSTPAVRSSLLAAFQQAPPPITPDVNDDGIVDATDGNLVRAALGKRCGQTGFSAAADVDHNCVVDVNDLSAVSRNLGKTYPSIVPKVTPAPNAAGWNNTAVTVSFTCAKVSVCPSPIVVTTEGAAKVVTGTGKDKAGKPASASVTVNIDRTVPAVSIATPAENFRSATPDVALSGTATDALSGIASLTCGGAAGTLTGSNFSCTVTIAPGSTTIQVRATDRAGNAATATRTVRLNRVPTASAGSAQSVVVGSTVSLDGSGSTDADGDPLTFHWTLVSRPAGSNAALSNAGVSTPTFVADRAGTYAVALVVNDGLADSASASVQVTAAPPPNRVPTASAGGPYSVVAKQPINLSGTGTDPDGDPLTYTWTFGDGKSGTGSSATHTYSGQGEFTATLTVDDGRGGVTTANAQVTVQPIVPGNRVPTASAGGPYGGTAKQSVALAGSGTDADGDTLIYVWSFGDGQTGAGASLAHAYSGQGQYTATLTVDDGRGGVATASAVVAVQPIVQGNRVPTAAAGGPYGAAARHPITFAGSGADPDGDSLTYRWAFGDGATAAGASPTHAYAGQGEYTATLTVDDGRGGVASATANVAVQPVAAGNRIPTATAGGPYTGTARQYISFAGSGTDPDGDALTYRWAFDDGESAKGAAVTHAFAGQGEHTATLIVDDGRGGIAHASALVIVQPVVPGNRIPTATAGGPYGGTARQPIAFAGSGTDPDGDPLTYRWTFGDDETAAGETPTHAYAGQGEYIATLTVDDGRGGVASATTLVVVQPIAPGNRVPTATAGGPYSGTAKQLIALTGSGTDPDGDALTFRWEFDDGGTATGAAVAHAFAGQGEHAATLTVDDGRGGVTTANAFVVVQPIAPGNRAPTATAGGPYGATANQAISFIGSGTDPDGDVLTYRWTFDDGGTASGASATHAFAGQGDHTATLTVDDGRGGVASATALVVVQPVAPGNRVPTATPGGPYTGIAKQSIAFVASGTDPDGDPLTFSWEFGDGTTGSGASPAHAYAGQGEYVATLTVADGRGGVASAAAFVTVQPIAPGNRIPTPTAGGPYSGTAKQPIVFTGGGTDPDGDALTFSWQFGDGQSGTGASPTHTYAGQGDFIATLTVDDGHGGVASAPATVIVDPIVPGNRVPTATAGGPYTATAGQSLALAGSGTDPDGDSLTFSWTFGDGQSGSGASPAHIYTAPGQFTATLTADDGRGGVAIATAHVTVQPVILPSNRVPTARPGGPYSAETRVQVAFDGTGSTDPDGDQLTFDWDLGDGTTGTGASLQHAYQSAGSFTVKLTVKDGRGGVGDSTVAVVVTSGPDRFAPIVELFAPKEAFPGTIVTLRADARDNVGVSSVAFVVDDGQPVGDAAAPYSYEITIPSVVAPGAKVVATATATDAAGNTGKASATIAIVAVADTQPPSIQLTGPTTTAPGKVVVLTAIADDNVAVSGVTFLVGGASVETDSAPPHQLTYHVPADAQVGSAILVTARATDDAGNSAEASRQVTVEATGDEIKPTTQIALPPSIEPGRPVTITAVPADGNGIAQVEVYVDGVLVDTKVAGPYQFTFDLPPDVPPGTELAVRVVITDFAGNTTTVTPVVVVRTPPVLTRGVISGEAYDDVAGLPLPGVQVRLSGTDENGSPYDQTATTDARGRFSISANPGHVVVELSKTGWTTARRVGDILGGQALEVFDGRLTALPAQTATLSVVLGGSLTTDSGELRVPTGALTSAAGLTFTTLTQQGLIGLLPPGWSPVAAVDVRATAQFVGVVTAAASPLTSVEANAALTFARYDEAVNAWRAIDGVVAPVQGNRLEHELGSSGQYAWLLPDTQPGVPPPPAAGAVLAGVAAPSIPASADMTISPQPKIIFYKPGVHSDVHSMIATAAPISSGSIVLAKITESYTFFSGSTLNLEPFTEDLLFFQASPAAAAVEARHRVTPSLTFEPNSLQLGVIDVELRTLPGGARLTSLFDVTAGGTIAAATGEQLFVPSGSSATNQTFTLDRLTPLQLGVQLPAELELVDAMQVGFNGRLSPPARLSIQAPAGLTDVSQVFLARLTELGGQTRLVFTALARLENGRLVSDTTFDGNPSALEGVREAGRYVFLRATVPTGFTSGRVTNAADQAFPDALVSSSNLALVALSAANGRYVAPTSLGQVTLSAVDVARFDSGSAQGIVMPPPQVLALDLRIVPEVPRVISMTPADDAANVPLGSPVVVRFSEPIDVGAAPASPLSLSGPSGTVGGSFTFSGGNSVLTFRPSAPLQPNTAYTVQLVASLRDMSGYQLASAAQSHFTSLDTIAPPPPPAGNFSASIPENGTTTVRATQGTAGRNDTVTILNVTKGTTTPVLLDSNGGFLTLVQAAVSDKLRVRIVDAVSNEISVDLPRFSQLNADGSITTYVGVEGGQIQGPNGTQVGVPEGAFPDGVTMTLRSVSEANFPIQLTADDRKFFEFSGGLTIDLGGKRPAGGRYLNLSWPTIGGETPDDQWIVGQIVETNGMTLFSTVDTARVINGKIRTSSPPCPGVTAEGAYGVVKSLNRPVGVNWARTAPGLVDRAIHAQMSFFAQLGAVAGLGGIGIRGLMTGAYNQLTTALTSSDLFPPVVCLPSLSGRVTISPNIVNLTVEPQYLLPGDSRVTVTNGNRGSRRVLPRYAADLNIAVPTLGASYYEVLADKSAFTSQSLGSSAPGGPPPLFKITRANNGETIVGVEPEWLTGTPIAITVRHVFSVLRSEVEDRGSAFAMKVQGVTTDYKAFFVRDSGQEEELSSLQYSVSRVSDTHIEVLIDTVERLDADIKYVLVKHDTSVKLGQPGPLNVSVEGASSDNYTVELTDAKGVARTVPFAKTASTAAIGNLVLKALPVTFDPPASPPALGRTANSVQLVDKTSSTGSFAIPESQIVNGGLEFGFEGDVSHDYEMVIGYNSPTFTQQLPTTTVEIRGTGYALHVPLPKMELTVYDLVTKARIRTVTSYAPPRNEPLNIGRLSDDITAPTLLTTESELKDIDPSQPFTLRFSESMDPQSLQQGIVLRCNGKAIEGEIRVSDLNRSATFVPTAALSLDQTCTIYLQVSDVSSNLVQASQGSVGLSTFQPKQIGTSAEVQNLRHIAHLSKSTAQQSAETVVGVTRGANTYKLLTFDVTQPTDPKLVGAVSPSTFPLNNSTWRVAVVEDIQDLSLQPASDCANGANTFSGNLAIVSKFNVNMSGVEFYNITNPAAPCLLGQKYLTADPTGIAYSRLIHGTVHLPGYAKGVTAVHTADNVIAYAAVEDVGVLGIDIGKNSPQPLEQNREVEGAVYGNYIDIAAIRDHLFAIDVDRNAVDVLTPTLAVIASVDVGDDGLKAVIAAENYTRDENGNGLIDPTEHRDVLFVAGASKITIIDVTAPANPTLLGALTFETSFQSAMSFDLSRKWLAAVSSGGVPTVFDMSRLDIQASGADRTLWAGPGQGAQTVALDAARGLLYVGRSTRMTPEDSFGQLEVWDIAGTQPRFEVTATVNGVYEAVIPVGEEANFDALVSARNITDQFEYEWQFDDGTQSMSRAPKHSAVAPGRGVIAVKTTSPKVSPKTATVNVTWIGIASLEWQQNGASLQADPKIKDYVSNETPRRIFPDQDTPQDISKHRLVNVVAKITPPAIIECVYFTAFDVDDPTENTAPLDDDSGGSETNDNRGSDKWGHWILQDGTSPTGAAAVCVKPVRGVATATFEVTRQPGDNFRVAAALTLPRLLRVVPKQHSTALTVDGLDLPIDGSAPATKEVWAIRSTSLLTVWRRLWVESDYMSPVQGNVVTGALDEFDELGTWTVSDLRAGGKTLARLPDRSPSPGRFAGGSLQIGTKALTVSNSAFAGGLVLETDQAYAIPCQLLVDGELEDCDIVEMFTKRKMRLSVPDLETIQMAQSLKMLLKGSGVEHDVTAIADAGDSITVTLGDDLTIGFSLTDDDSGQDGAIVPAPELGLLASAFEPAFVEVKNVVSGNGPAPFVLNTPDAARRQSDHYAFDNKGARAANYWVVYILGAFQPYQLADGDPISEAGGVVDGRVDHVSRFDRGGKQVTAGLGGAVFSESFVEGRSSNQLQAETVVHEIGHLFGGSHDKYGGFDGGVMNWPDTRTSSDYSPATLAKIRSVTTP